MPLDVNIAIIGILGIPIRGTPITSDEIIERIKKDDNYIKFSHGGVTVSGGEPLLQTKFLIELFTKLKELGYHTAIDTSRYVPYYL